MKVILIFLSIISILSVACNIDNRSYFTSIESDIVDILNDSKFRVNPKVRSTSKTLFIELNYIGQTNFNNESVLKSYSAYMLYKLKDSFPKFDTVSVRIWYDLESNKFWQTDYNKEKLYRSNSMFINSPTLVELVGYSLWNITNEEYIQCDSAINNLKYLPKWLKCENYSFDGGLMDLLLIHSFECDGLFEDKDSLAYKGIHGLYFFYGTHPVENKIYEHMQYYLGYCKKGGVNREVIDSIRNERRKIFTNKEDQTTI